MPSHVPSDEADLASSDEVKVFHDEGEFSEERRSSSIGDTDVTEEMNELKQTLIEEDERPATQQSQGRNAASAANTSRQTSSQSQSSASQQSNQPSVSSAASGTRQSPSTQIPLESSASNSSHPTSSSLCAFGYFNHPAFHPSNGSLAPVRSLA